MAHGAPRGHTLDHARRLRLSVYTNTYYCILAGTTRFWQSITCITNTGIGVRPDPLSSCEGLATPDYTNRGTSHLHYSMHVLSMSCTFLYVRTRILIACMIIVRPDVANYITRCAFRAQYKKSFENYQTLSPPSLY